MITDPYRRPTNQEPKPKVEAGLSVITPQRAAQLLEKNSHNRDLNANLVRNYADQMESGEWRINGEPIIIADNGDVMDGQHRLEACVKSGIALETLVVSGVKRETFPTIDTGKARNAKDVLGIDGLDRRLARVAGPASGLCITIEHSGLVYCQASERALITPAQRIKWVKANPKILEVVEWVLEFASRPRVIPDSLAATLWFYLEILDEATTQEFFPNFLSGANLDPDDPRFIVRQRIQSIRSTGERLHNTQKAYITLKAWDWYRKGKKVRKGSRLFSGLNEVANLLKDASKKKTRGF